jgi:mannose-6-phosphate isomerase-like protein (cupin superfamily)
MEVANGQVAKTVEGHQLGGADKILDTLDGHGLMHLGDQTFDVFAGDTMRIILGNEHCIESIGSVNLVLLCCCSPAFAHDDTVLVA